MREIKFRYRIIDTKSNYPIFMIFTLEQIEQISDDFQSIIQNYSILSRDEYTGRKDKNGKEIYEGDIIEMTALTGAEGLSPGFIFDKLRVEIRWDNENALWSFNLDADWSEFYDKKDKRGMVTFRNHVRALMFNGKIGKIIGNIYENSELLKKEK